MSSLFDFSDDDAQFAPSEMSQASESDNFVIIRRPDLHADAAECLEAVDRLGKLSFSNSLCASKGRRPGGQLGHYYIVLCLAS